MRLTSSAPASRSRDLVRQVRERALLRTLGSAALLYPLAVVGVGAIGWLVQPDSIAARALVSGGLAATVVLVIVAYVRRRRHYARQLVNELNERIELHRDQELAALGAELMRVDLPRAVRQLTTLRRCVPEVRRLVAQRFDPRELAYQRYTMLVDGVARGVIENLTRMSTAAQHPSPAVTPANRRDTPSLEREIGELLGANDDALTTLDAARARLVTLRTDPRAMQLDLAQAVDALESLVGITEGFDVRAGVAGKSAQPERRAAQAERRPPRAERSE